MAGKQAKILTDTQFWRLLTYASSTRYPERDQVIVLLSVKAGLRAGEIAHLTWDMVLDAAGDIAPVIELRNSAAKNQSGRLIPIHPDLHDAMAWWKARTVPRGPVVRSARGGSMHPVSIVNWFNRAYRAIGP